VGRMRFSLAQHTARSEWQPWPVAERFSGDSELHVVRRRHGRLARDWHEQDTKDIFIILKRTGEDIP